MSTTSKEENNKNDGAPCNIADGIVKSMDKMEISDDKLFAAPPPKEDCPICMLPMPYANQMCDVVVIYMPCCGKTLCMGCTEAALDKVKTGELKHCCAFCRMPNPKSQEELIERVKKRIALGDREAMDWLGAQYYHGHGGFPQDYNKGIELWKQAAADLGVARTNNALGSAYYNGKGVEKDEKKAFYYYRIAAMRGHEYARCMLGGEEYDNGNVDRALKHYMIAARSGEDEGMSNVEAAYKQGYISEDEHAPILRYKASQNEMMSNQRTKALEDEKKAIEDERKASENGKQQTL